MKSRVGKAREAFTLIELLVVIAVIALLAGIMFPVLTSAKKTAYQTKCASNLNNFHKAFMMYAGDWGGRIPLPAVAPSPQLECRVWVSGKTAGSSLNQGALWPYVRTVMKNGDKSNLWSCPLSIKIKDEHLAAYYSPGLNYVMNAYLRGAHSGEANNAYDPTIEHFFDGFPSDAPRKPSKLILLYEGVQDRAGYCDRQGCPFYTRSDKVHQSFAQMKYPYIAQNYHAGRCNFLFMDGHVRALRADETWSKETYDEYKTESQFRKWLAVYDGWGDCDMWDPHLPSINYP